MKYLIIPFVLVSLALGDATVWDYDLTYLPDGWSKTECWYFVSNGILLELEVSNSTRSDSIITETVVIPDNCDSVILHCEQHLSLGVWSQHDNLTAYANVSYKLDSNPWESIYIRWWWNGTTQQPLHLSVPPVSGNLLSFRFKGHASALSFPPYHNQFAYVTWRLSNLTLTFYGDDLSLENTTWGDIKSTLVY